MHSGTATLKDATSEAIRDWVTNVETTHYILGSAAGPHPYPMMVRAACSGRAAGPGGGRGGWAVRGRRRTGCLLEGNCSRDDGTGGRGRKRSATPLAEKRLTTGRTSKD